jgi:hypothetical protein
LKGHGFSRAEAWREQRVGLSRWGMFWGLKPIPRGLKAGNFPQDALAARLEAVPFQNKSDRNLKHKSDRYLKCDSPAIAGRSY